MRIIKISIYILTHKKFDYDGDELYIPLLNGSESFEDDFGYLRDDTGDNISNLNKYYAELTGQYWAWKNSDADIIGFCHYRRFLAKNVFLKEKIDAKEIEEILTDFDIIMPKIKYMRVTNIENISNSYFKSNYGVNPKEYDKLRDVIKKFYPDYLDTFDYVLNSKQCWWYNMFICKKELADEYFEWLFDILKKMEKEVNFDEYESKRVLGFLAERLLTIFIIKNNLKVNEKHIIFTESKWPHLSILGFRFPIFADVYFSLKRIL